MIFENNEQRCFYLTETQSKTRTLRDKPEANLLANISKVVLEKVPENTKLVPADNKNSHLVE